MSEFLSVIENGITMVFDLADRARLLHFSALPFNADTIGPNHDEQSRFNLVEVNISGLDKPLERHGAGFTATAPGYTLRYQQHQDSHNRDGRKLVFTLYDTITAAQVEVHYQFYTHLALIRSWSVIRNQGHEAFTVEYLSSFVINGIAKESAKNWGDNFTLHIPHNSWTRELQWRQYRFDELGFMPCIQKGLQRSSKPLHYSNTGAWSSKEYLPMGYLEDSCTGAGLFWQIEHNGSWHWEIGDQANQLYLQLGGPNEFYHHWFKQLQPGDAFCSVPVAIGVTQAGFTDAMATLTQYRRRTRRLNDDNQQLGVIFNDYMNCLFGDPTTAKLLPLIDAAAEAGAEYFCIDCGWYDKGEWWNGVGQWLPSEERFPEGIQHVIRYIREKGMIPGLWLELEVMGVKSPKLAETDDSWFFMRHGKRVFDRSRYQLDFTSPAVIRHADEVIDRLVTEYGVGYIKMDYNIEPGIGTEQNADSAGDGLLKHNRAWLAWLDRVFTRYPQLIIENCGSGGLRMDYAMLSRCSIQSTSDQEDYLKYATIAANAPTAVTPEQAAIWSYPLRDDDEQAVIFNQVSAMLLRIHQSGHLAELSERGFQQVKEAIRYYKTLRQHINTALPFWPLGLSSFTDEWVALGMKSTEGKVWLAVWRREGPQESCALPLTGLKGSVRQGYPATVQHEAVWHNEQEVLTVTLPPRSAVIFEISR
ncbi:MULTISPECIES: alpha-galactosidase [Enterobacteriaceae]|uniref:Alpha-galactosidase n=1 Tax=Raoultella lignicola TaxID=3040939 RepID=A0ABU9F6L6_9ENTR|nr:MULTISPECIES: alpha-galactosidase [Enterobacteriaceae]MRT51178.1 alpha-galactosidase [Raoultella sp. RIT712]QNK06375.1 alpha-galactosidase [Enterobacter sp. JUb54]ROS07310.1 alpha-galactosidase [Raoultella sp. BIGb0399]